MKTIELPNVKFKPLTADDRVTQAYKLSGHISSVREGGRHGRRDDALMATSLVKGPAYVTHSGLLDYLALCWSNHHGVVLKPDDIWFVILVELTALIAKKPADYASMFTTTPDKRQAIIVPTDDIRTIDPQLVIDHLKDCVPTKVDLFLPTFSTTNPDVRFAANVAFCDMVSPYYDYMTFMCGFPAVRLEGEIGDWGRLVTAVSDLCDLFDGKVVDYLMRCFEVVLKLQKAYLGVDSAHIMETMVKLEICGSGSQYEMSGWIMNLSYDASKVQLDGLPPHLAVMGYTNLNTNRKFKLLTGLTESSLDGVFLVPRYGQHVIEDIPMLEAKDDDTEKGFHLKLERTDIVPTAKKLGAKWTME